LERLTLVLIAGSSAAASAAVLVETDADNKPVPVAEPERAAGPEFRPGQPVDARDRLGSWYEAVVCSTRTMPDSAMLIHFTHWSSANDEWIPLPDGTTDRVTLPGRSGRVFRAGHPPRAGMLVDAYDDHPQMLKFLSATIREVDSSRGVMKIHYNGYVEKFDKWFPTTSELIAPWGSRTRKRYPFRPKLTAGYAADDSGAGASGASSSSGSAISGSSSSSSSSSGKPPRKKKPPRQLNLGTDAFERFEAGLAHRGLWLVSQAGDGNCLFRSIAHQVYGDPELHGMCRALVVEYLTANKTWLSTFVEDDGVDQYLADMARPAVWGGEPELVAFHEIYRRPISIFSGEEHEGAGVIAAYSMASLPGATPIRLSYYGGGHYDSVVGRDSAAALLPAATAGAAEREAIAVARSGAADRVANRMGAAAAAARGAAAGGDVGGDAASVDPLLVAALQASREAFAESLMIEQALAVSMGANAPQAAAASASSAGAAGMTTADALAATAAAQGAAGVGAAAADWAGAAIHESDTTVTDSDLVQQAIAASRAAADEEAIMAAALVESERAAVLAASAHNEDAALAAALAASVAAQTTEGAVALSDDWEEAQFQEAMRRSAVASAHSTNNAESMLEDEDLRAAIQLSAEMLTEAQPAMSSSSAAAGQLSSGRGTPDTASPVTGSSSSSTAQGQAAEHDSLNPPLAAARSQSSAGAAAFAFSPGGDNSPTAEDVQLQISMAFLQDQQ
jgi:hypothetical protein